MRRIYESQALEYDEENPHAPKPKSDDKKTRRAINWDAASHAFMPRRLREWAIGVAVETNQAVYRVDEPVHFRVTLANRIPFPVAVPTDSPVRWTWSIDGVDEASHVVEYPSRRSLFRFRRSERKQFERSWPQRIRESDHEWRPAARGEHTLGVRLTVPGADRKGLSAETTFRIE